MQAKKKLISRLALGAGSVLVIAAIVGLVCLRIDWSDRRGFEESQERAKQQRIEKARAYLAELAGRIDKLPVDATLASEIESHYFEEQASGPFYVWAMDTKGEFQFGVPQAAFSKVNAVYDSEVVPRLKEGCLPRPPHVPDEPGRRQRRDRPRADGGRQVASRGGPRGGARRARPPLRPQPLGARALLRAVHLR
jgi:hypothetical protein